MKEVFPNYYHKFECIKDKCRNNCCIGWDIDIDDETLSFYQSLDTPLGQRIRDNITGRIPHFILTEDDRCPFLNENGLCEIITEYGEDAICDICYLHPRFKNFLPSFSEIGLGMACEEVTRIILTETDKFHIDSPDAITEEEQLFLSDRQDIFDLLQDRSKTIGERLSALADKYRININFDIEKLRIKFLSLERLDDEWTEVLNNIKGFDFDKKIFELREFQLPFEQLAVYYIFRYFRKEVEEKSIRLTLISCYLIGVLCAFYGYSFEKMKELVRMCSAEVEYNEDNIDEIMNCTDADLTLSDIQLKKTGREQFDAVYRIMEQSFPADERRPYSEQEVLLENPHYSLYIYQEQDVKAFIAAWEFDDFVYVEHFAVDEKYRNARLGGKMLKEFTEKQNKTVCLEVELPETALAKRRIGFYERNGFFYNDYEYFQPPISEGKKIVPLAIMTSGKHIDYETFNGIRSVLYKEVYNYNGE